MTWVAVSLALVAILLGLLQLWRVRSRAFRAEVVIESLRLWRELVQDYRDRHPEERTKIGVAEEAAYMAVHSEHRQKVLLKAKAECDGNDEVLCPEMYASSVRRVAHRVRKHAERGG